MTSWKQLPLESFASAERGAITDGPFGSNLTSAHYTDSGPQVVRLQNIGDGEYKRSPAHISRDHFDMLRKHEVSAGDLLIASLGEVLPRACLMPADIGPAIVKADCIRVRLSMDVEPRWVLYALQRPEARDWARDQLHGVGRPRLGLKTIRQIPIPAAPLSEQRRIVELLDDHLSRLDAAESSLARAMARAAGLERAYVAQSFAWQPDGWREVGVDEITGGDRSRSIIGPFGSNLTTKDYRDDGVPLVFVRNVVRGDFTSPTRFVSAEKAADLAAHGVRYGDLVITKMGDPPGSAAVYDSIKPGIVTADVIRLRPAEGFLSSYLMFAMQSPSVRRVMDRITSGVAQRKVSLTRFRDHILFPVPSVDEQARIANELSDLVDDRTRLNGTIEVSQERCSMLRRALLAAAFSGQLTGAASDSDRIEAIAAAL
ncbi:hypothetical protein FVP74_13910 [Microbacterium saccharophilum]|uniref:Type I restriction modification DNA specificity domain-containing protein n=1 Tax=Microbacterium saccharophilum TaxID=1213358 RepID=A0A5C8HRF9_9MICO|nr:restriction endonuclease subunit S [Microbacterium saccharophilum]TXK08345.1 hypothetical protein FVP74_13910 [Microbacterium saccharophilum]GEP48676.1 hypothetical protein MSA03_21840 [Microbacterium saccharophilum]